jgi:hypothetical protein
VIRIDLHDERDVDVGGVPRVIKRHAGGKEKRDQIAKEDDCARDFRVELLAEVQHVSSGLLEEI